MTEYAPCVRPKPGHLVLGAAQNATDNPQWDTSSWTARRSGKLARDCRLPPMANASTSEQTVNPAAHSSLPTLMPYPASNYFRTDDPHLQPRPCASREPNDCRESICESVREAMVPGLIACPRTQCI